ncbi:MAG TPA: hypothetical protein VFV92_13370, partial [Candidatus Bathyarchaeia archaeon]|nr:hypothetical protein [Candidatus Bathyarchaeia archaeon]
NFTELIEILAKYWDVFKDNFSRGSDRMREILFPLNQIRDVIAHNCELKDEEKKRFESLMDYWRGMQV